MARRAKTNIPDEQKAWVKEQIGNDIYIVCSDRLREEYFLYKEDSNKSQYLIMSGETPVKFETYLNKQRDMYGKRSDLV